MRNYFILVLLIQLLTTTTHADSFSDKLVKAAKDRIKHKVVYDGSYVKIPYPNGDVPKNRGVCTDVIIRTYRSVGIDLQVEIHQDMKAHFDKYPAIWGLKKPDPNIDHRRVPNLQTFFLRKGKRLKPSERSEDYRPGDIVTWMIPGNLPHIGIVVDERSKDEKRYLIVHNIGSGPQMEDVLFAFPITGHYQYPKR